ncbi:hypothetical protein BC332_28491 [Capsicum chinense]|nr:hypothetical protein BC332_28491 [Capsicum chinense]
MEKICFGRKWNNKLSRSSGLHRMRALGHDLEVGYMLQQITYLVQQISDLFLWFLMDYLSITIGRLYIASDKIPAFQVDVTVEATVEEHNITLDNPSSASKEEEKVEPVSLGEWKNYPSEGFNISNEAPKILTWLINDYSEWIADGQLKHHAGRDCGPFVASYTEYLNDELQVPNDVLDARLLYKRYTALLRKYGESKDEKPYVTNVKDPRQPKPNFVAPNEEQLAHID